MAKTPHTTLILAPSCRIMSRKSAPIATIIAATGTKAEGEAEAEAVVVVPTTLLVLRRMHRMTFIWTLQHRLHLLTTLKPT